MEYTVRDLLKSGKFPEMHLLYGAAGIDRTIKGIRIIEVQDMERFLLGKELLLLSFKVYIGMDGRTFLSHLETLLKKDVSGFIVKRNPEYDPDGHYFSMLVQMCSQCNVPVIEIPLDLCYWSIEKYVMMQVMDKYTARLTYFKLTHDNFTNILLRGSDVKNPTEDILVLLGAMLGNPVALYYSNNVCFASTNGDRSDFSFADNVEPYHPDILTKFKYLRQEKDHVQYIVQIDILGRVEIHLVVTEENEPLVGLDYMALENAIITLQFSLVTMFVQNEIEKKYQRDIGYSILNGELSHSEMADAAHLLQLKEDREYQVLAFQSIQRSRDGQYTNEQLEEVGIIEGELSRMLNTDYLYRNLSQLYYIHEINPSESPQKFRGKIDNIYEAVQKQIIHRKKDTDFQIGIGNVVKGYSNLKESFENAKKTIDDIRYLRILTGHNDISVVDSSKLGFFRLFEHLKDPHKLMEYVPESLKKLYQHDKEHHGELIDTLQVYLENNQSSKKTSQEMNVHYRTITYRLEKIQEISGFDFHNSNEMLAVRNGLMMIKIATTL